MNKFRPIVNIAFVLFLIIVLHNAIICALSNVFTFLRSDDKYDAMVNTYEYQIDLLKREIAEYELALGELKISSQTTSVLSKIALRDIYSFYDYLIISTRTKVNAGSAVVNEDGLVGIVSSSNKTTAKVSLITGSDDLSVKVGDNYGILVGYDKKNRTFQIHNIDNYKVVKIGDEVYTSGLQDIPSGIKIGKVIDIDKEGVEQIVYVEPYVSFEDLNYLVVLNS